MVKILEPARKLADQIKQINHAQPTEQDGVVLDYIELIDDCNDGAYSTK